MIENKFIVFEGIDGAGKSTQIQRIKDYIENNIGVNVFLTREPGGTPMSEDIRAVFKKQYFEKVTFEAELMLMNASRSQLTNNVIIPALIDSWVFSDRFSDSTDAYQGYGRKNSLSLIKKVKDITLKGFSPNLTILLDLPPSVSLSRAQERGERDRIEMEDIDFFERTRQGYLSIAKESPEKYMVVDANKSVDDLFTDISTKFEAWYMNQGDNIE
jgi:dTMP kinase